MSESITDPNAGIGWYEFITSKATTEIAYVHESGDVYVPDGGWGPTEPFHLAASRGKARRLLRVDHVLEAAAKLWDDLTTRDLSEHPGAITASGGVVDLTAAVLDITPAQALDLIRTEATR